jgi:hypothetical protein
MCFGTRRVGPRVEAEDDGAAAEGAERDSVAVLVGEFEVRRLLSLLDHRWTVARERRAPWSALELALGCGVPAASKRGSVHDGLTGVRSTRDSSAVADFAQRIFELATGALAEQERQVSELRGRGAALLAAGAVVASLLTKPVFHAAHPQGAAEILATAGGLLGAGALLVSVVLLLRPYQLGFSVKAQATYRALWDRNMLEQPMVDLALAEAFEERRARNAKAVKRLSRLLGLALAALVLEATGLALAAALSS